MNTVENLFSTRTVKPHTLNKLIVLTLVILISPALVFATDDKVPPVANNDTYSVRSGTVLDVGAENGLLANDSDPDGDDIFVQSFQAPDNGTLNVVTDGSFTYSPDAGFAGTETIMYTLSDGTSTAQATLTIEVNNQPPVANNDAYYLPPGTILDVDAESGLLVNDSDPDGDPLFVQSFTAAENGDLNITTDGSFTYTPGEGFAGVETSTYTISDGVITAQATLKIGISTNNPPIANDDFYTMRAYDVLVVGFESRLLANDSDPDGDFIHVTSITLPQNGVIISDTQDGMFTYLPDKDFVGTEELIYTITDGFATSTANLTIEVTNNPPVANDDVYTMLVNETMVVDPQFGLLANDSDPDGDPIKVTSVTPAQNGEILSNSDGSFTYLVDEDFVGVEEVTYTITDGIATATANLTIEVMSDTNAPPVAENDTYSTEFGTLLKVNAENGVLANDTDPGGGAIEVVFYTVAENGKLLVEADGSFVYEPHDGFIGMDFASYTISNGTQTSEGKIYIDVVDTPPVAASSCKEYDPQTLSRGFGGNWTAQQDKKSANFSVPASQRGGGIIKATLSADHAEITPDLRVCDNSSCTGGSIVTHTAIEETGATVEFQAAGGQNYHFDILQFGNAPENDYPVSYSLIVQYEDRIDCWEGNDTVQEAKQIVKGETIKAYMLEGYEANSLKSGEYADWYTFELDQEAVIEINMLQPAGMHLMRLKLFDQPDENEVDVLLEGQQDEKGQPFTARSTRVRSPGTYYLRIRTLLSDDGFVSGSDDQPEHWNQEYEMIVNADLATSTEDEQPVPVTFSLSQNYPNPFNPATAIKFALPRTEMVRLEVFNTIGKRVSMLVDEQLPAGNHNVTFDASNLPSGIYIYRIKAGRYTAHKKLTLIK